MNRMNKKTTTDALRAQGVFTNTWEPTNEWVLQLYSEEPQHVKEAVTALMEITWNHDIQNELLGVIANWELDDTCAAIFATVVLGHKRVREAIPFYFDMLDSDYDTLSEAAHDAIALYIEQRHDQIFPVLAEFVQDRIENDPHYARISGVSLILECTLAGNQEAERFLVWMLETDKETGDHTAGEIVVCNNTSHLPVLRRLLAVYEAYEDDMKVNELRWAYCTLVGAITRDRRQELWKKPWEERWQWLFDRMGKTEQQVEQESKDRLQKLAEKQEASHVSFEQEKKIIDNYKYPPFSLPEYLQVRVRSDTEESFEGTLKLLGFEEHWSVESVQERINEAQKPKEVLERMTGGLTVFPSEGALVEFMERLGALWNITPREELGGLTPEEMFVKEQFVSKNREANESREQLRKYMERDLVGYDDEDTEPQPPYIRTEVKVGRNDPCPCGSGKKYKKCCGDT